MANRPVKFATVTDDGALAAGTGKIVGFQLIGGNGDTMILYDNASAASGTELGRAECLNIYPVFMFPKNHMPEFKNGVYADLFDAGTTLHLWYV